MPRGHGMGTLLWGTDGRGASGTAAGEALVLGVCEECSGGSEPKQGLVLPEERCPQGRTWGEPGLRAPGVVQITQPSWFGVEAVIKIVLCHAVPWCTLPSHTVLCHAMGDVML